MAIDRRESRLIALCVVVAVGFFLLGFLAGRGNFGKEEVAFKEAVPYRNVLEIKDFKVARLYNSADKFTSAELDIRVSFSSPHEWMPEEYKKRELHLLVKDISSLDRLTTITSAFESNKCVRLIPGSGVAALVSDSEKITLKGNRKAIIIKTIKVKPEGYVFLKY